MYSSPLRTLRRFIPLLSLLGAMACNAPQAGKEHPENTSCAPVNPNGDSERALVMRKMTQLSEANAKALRSGENLVPYDGSFDTLLLSSTGTMPVDEAFFKGMAQGYLSQLHRLYAAQTREEKITLHNNVVQSCQDCHQQTCRGPLKRIDKMMVTVTTAP